MKKLRFNSAIWILLVLGLLFRLVVINSREIWYDDAFSYWLSLNSFPEIVRGTVADTMPPLYYFLLHLWMSVSTKLWFLRLLNIFINLAAIFLLGLFVKDYFGEKQARISVAFAVITPFQIYHAQELRMYALLMLGQIGLLFFLYRYIKSGNYFNRNLWLSIVFGSIAMYAHNLAIFVILACNLLFFIAIQRETFYKLALVQAGIVLSFMPWLVFLPEQIEKIQTAFWTPQPGFLEVLQTALTHYSFLPMPSIFTMLAAVFIFPGLALVLYWNLRNFDPQRIVLLGMSLLPGVFLIVGSYLMRPIYVPRALISCGILFYAAAAEMIVRTWKIQIGKIATVCFFASLLIGLPFVYTFEAFPRSSFKAGADYLFEVNTEDTDIIHDNKLTHFPMSYYQPEMRQIFIADETGTSNDTLAQASQDVIGFYAVDDIQEIQLNDIVYFVVFEKAIQEYTDLGYEHPKLAYLEDHMMLIDLHKFGDLFIYQFGGSR